MQAAEDVSAAEKLLSYPLSVIAFIFNVPNPTASAIADPDIPENIILLMILTCPRPPGIGPTRALANLKILLVIPPLFIKLPAKMKKGTASNGKEVALAYILCASMGKILDSFKIKTNIIPIKHILIAIDIPIIINTNKITIINKVNILVIPFNIYFFNLIL
jgi:hypothetical protein